MKIAGKKIEAPGIEIVVIPRKDGDLVFKAAPVLDYSDFDKLCPQPIAPTMIKPGGKKVVDVEDKAYKAALTKWNEQRVDWLIIKSLQATENLEWETVDLSNSDTWANYRKEWEDSGLTVLETNAIIMAVTDACGLNAKKIEQATKAFLAGQRAAQESLSSQTTEQKSTESGEPVSVSE